MLEARGDQPFSMVKVKGHATASDLRQGLVEEVDLKGNMAADALAVLGACCELGPEEAGQEARVRAAVAIDIQRMMVEILCCRGKTGHGIIRDSGSIDCEGAFSEEEEEDVGGEVGSNSCGEDGCSMDDDSWSSGAAPDAGDLEPD